MIPSEPVCPSDARFIAVECANIYREGEALSMGPRPIKEPDPNPPPIDDPDPVPEADPDLPPHDSPAPFPPVTPG